MPWLRPAGVDLGLEVTAADLANLKAALPGVQPATARWLRPLARRSSRSRLPKVASRLRVVVSSNSVLQ
jgi:hypothetical protein